MNREIETILVSTLQQIPSLEYIETIPRERLLRLVFEGSVKHQHEKIGTVLKSQLDGSLVGIHLSDPEIKIAKLITNQEIEDNQDFFERCAKDYRDLAKELILSLVDQLGLDLNQDFPLETFNKLHAEKRANGTLGSWNYDIHGFHCCFDNKDTLQSIEVPLVFGREFGDLDPCFFMDYIKTTSAYHPLPVDIFEDYEDGVRINERMIELRKFERIHSNIIGHDGIVVVDREKVIIKRQRELNHREDYKFNFWRFIGLKK